MKFSLSLDDYSPRPNTNDLKWANKLIQAHPHVKIDLFVPAAYGRLGERPYYLSEHVKWVASVKQLPANYNICLHGLYHRRSIKDYKWHRQPESNNDEFQYINYKQAASILDRIEAEFDKVGLKHSKVFRPPGWKISREAAQLLTDRGYMIAGNAEYYGKLKDAVPNMKWVNMNWDLLTEPPKGPICAYGHTSEWTTNSMNEARYRTIMSVLETKHYDMCFIEEM